MQSSASSESSSDEDFNNETETTTTPDNVEGSGDTEDIAIEEAADRRLRRIRTKDRTVCNLDAALDTSNYEPCPLVSTSKQLTTPMDRSTGQVHVWSNQPPQRAPQGRRRRQERIRNKPGVKHHARQAKTEREAWDLLFTPNIISLIVKWTNDRIQMKKQGWTPEERERRRFYSYDTDQLEILALLGLFLLRGLQGQNLQDYTRLFHDVHGHPAFGACMSSNRFTFLISNLGFDDKRTREERHELDRFTAIRELFQEFFANCSDILVPNDVLCIDETLYGTRVGISFKQYNANKPSKYGLLLKSINEVRVPYTHYSIAYAGKPPAGDGPFHFSSVFDQVKLLIDSLSSKVDIEGRTVIMDR